MSDGGSYADRATVLTLVKGDLVTASDGGKHGQTIPSEEVVGRAHRQNRSGRWGQCAEKALVLGAEGEQEVAPLAIRAAVSL